MRDGFAILFGIDIPCHYSAQHIYGARSAWREICTSCSSAVLHRPHSEAFRLVVSFCRYEVTQVGVYSCSHKLSLLCLIYPSIP